MKAPIQIHSEWEDVEIWFNKRVGELGLTDYQAFSHVESLTVEYAIDQSVYDAARKLGFAIGKSIK